MAGLAGEPVDLVLDARAVTRSAALDPPGNHRALPEPLAQDGVHARVGVRDVARQRLAGEAVAHERERAGRGVTGLGRAGVPVDRPAVEAGRGAGLEAAGLEAQPVEGGRQPARGALAVAPARPLARADVDGPAEERARGEDHGAGTDLQAGARDDARDARLARGRTARGAAARGLWRGDEVHGGILPHEQVRGPFQLPPEGGGVGAAVALAPRAPDGRPLAGVEHPEVHGRGVRHAAHEPAQRVNLAHELPLSHAADGGVARHLPDGVQARRQQQGAGAEAGGGVGGLRPRVPPADDDHVVGVHPGWRLFALRIGPPLAPAPGFAAKAGGPARGRLLRSRARGRGGGPGRRSAAGSRCRRSRRRFGRTGPAAGRGGAPPGPCQSRRRGSRRHPTAAG